MLRFHRLTNGTPGAIPGPLSENRTSQVSELALRDAITSGSSTPCRRTSCAVDSRADASTVLMHPTEKTVQAVAFDYLRKEWKILDNDVKADFETLAIHM